MRTAFRGRGLRAQQHSCFLLTPTSRCIGGGRPSSALLTRATATLSTSAPSSSSSSSTSSDLPSLNSSPSSSATNPMSLLQLHDTERVFAPLSNRSLAFSLGILHLCSLYQPFSNYGPQMLKGLDKMGLGKASDAVMRSTFFRHFCAGETLEGVGQVVRQYERSGVRCIFDFSVEDALTPQEWASNAEGLIQKMHTYASTFEDRVRFVPLKITGLCSPTLLERMSKLIYTSTTTGALTDNPWMEGLLYEPTPAFPTKKGEVVQPLSSNERADLRDALDRVSAICVEARRANLSLLFDAEQTPRQPAINWFTRKLSGQFNRDKVVVYNTVQLYLKGNLRNLEQDLVRAKEGGYLLGAKVVRGAYIHTETKYAQSHGLELPVLDGKDKTDEQYDAAVALLLRNIEHSAIVIATHSADSVEKSMRVMHEQGIERSSPRVHFAQLMGMCEDLTLSLGQLGYNASKLLPYGPLENVMPYLIRRVQENSSVLGGTARERQLIWRELKRRFTGGGGSSGATRGQKASS